MSLDIFGGDLKVQGTLTAVTIGYPSGSIGDAAVGTASPIQATKIVNPVDLEYQVKPGTTITADTGTTLRIIRGATCTVADIRAAITGTIATGADRTVDVDLQKSTGGGAFATILSAMLHFTNVSTLRAATVGTISNPNLVVGDILQIVVTVAGAAGAQALGLHVNVDLREQPS